MSTPKLAVVTASTNLARALPCLKSWVAQAQQPFFLVVVTNGADAAPEGVAALHPDDWPLAWWHSQEYLGTVPAFRRGTEIALEIAAKLGDEIVAIACLHDDLEIHEANWDQKVLKHFQHHPACGLLGFGGAIGLGAADIYQVPYDPMQLARVGFRSNLTDAEVHGIRSLRPERCAALDSFSMIFRPELAGPTWQWMGENGLTHHFHDGAAACLAARAGAEVWFLPIRCTHFGGRTAVADAGYQAWAKTKNSAGDQGFWVAAHAICYEAFRDVLPIRV